METMLKDYKIGFSDRLNKALDASIPNIPPKGRGRQTFVGKLFGVSQKGVRKWLEGEGLPRLEQCLEIADKLNISLEWLMLKRGGMQVNPGTNAANQTEKAIDLFMLMPQDIQREWLTYGEYLLKNRTPQTPAKKDQAPRKTISA